MTIPDTRLWEDRGKRPGSGGSARRWGLIGLLVSALGLGGGAGDVEAQQPNLREPDSAPAPQRPGPSEAAAQPSENTKDPGPAGAKEELARRPLVEDESAPPLEALMTADEIFLNLVVEPDPKAFAPKGNLSGPPFELPLDPAGLAISPADRVRSLVPPHLYEHFDLYLYVNKAERGLWAQQMFVFENENGVRDRAADPVSVPLEIARPEDEGAPRQALDGPRSVPAGPDAGKPDALVLTLTDRWLVSTGRERRERYFTETPLGLFRLDRNRFYKFVRSVQWNGAAMPFAMFFDWDYATRKSGYAIHAAGRTTQRYLGRRASGGCIRLSLAHAEALFMRIREGYAGKVPDMPFDRAAGLTKSDGTIRLNDAGRPIFEQGYRVLLVVDDLAKEIVL